MSANNIIYILLGYIIIIILTLGHTKCIIKRLHYFTLTQRILQDAKSMPRQK